MDTNFNRMEKTVGTFIILIAVILLTVLLIIGRGKDWFKTYVTYYAVFEESYNLQDDAPVKLLNTVVGKVLKITLFEEEVKVELKVMEDYADRIKTDSVAVVQSTSYFLYGGTDYVSIEPGTPEAAVLPEGREIPSAKKKGVLDTLNEFVDVQEMVENILSAAQNVVDIIGRLKDPEGPLFTTLDNVSKTTSHVEGITGDLNAGRGTMGQLLKSSALLETIQDALDKVDGILVDVKEASSRTPKTMDQVQESLDRVKHILDEVFESVSSIKSTLKEVEKGSSEIPTVTRSVRRGIQEARDSLDNADKIIQSLQKNILIRGNLPPEPEGETTDAGLR